MQLTEAAFYMGTKEIEATPMTLSEYNKYRGWEMPKGEQGENEGYLVEYLDSQESNHPDHKGYISWSPKEVFENAYRPNGKLTFGHAVVALKKGKRVCRSGWNGKGMFVFMQVPAKISVAEVVPKMQSLPQSVKDEFKRRFDKTTKDVGNDSAHNHSTIDYSNQLALVKPDNEINGWTPSGSDALAEDWMILD